MEDEPAPKLIKPWEVVLDLVLAAGFFVFITSILLGHSPATDPLVRYATAGFTGFCLTGVFWMAVQLFRVTLADQLIRRRQKDEFVEEESQA